MPTLAQKIAPARNPCVLRGFRAHVFFAVRRAAHLARLMLHIHSMSDLERLREALRDAPGLARPTAPGLAGWECDAGFVCVRCAGRILQRGCRLPDDAHAVWGQAPGECALCGEGCGHE